MSYLRKLYTNSAWAPTQLTQLDDFIVTNTLAQLDALDDGDKQDGKLYLVKDTGRFYRYDVVGDEFIFLLEGMNDMIGQLQETGLLSIDAQNSTMSKTLTYESNRDVISKGISLGHNMTDILNYLNLPGNGWATDANGNYIVTGTILNQLSTKRDVATSYSKNDTDVIVGQITLMKRNVSDSYSQVETNNLLDGKLNLTGGTLTGGLNTVSINTQNNNITCGTGQIYVQDAILSNNIYLSSGKQIEFDFGSGATGLEAVIRNKGYSSGFDIVGSTALGDGVDRMVKLWDSLNTGTITCTSIDTQNSNIVCGTGDVFAQYVNADGVYNSGTQNLAFGNTSTILHKDLNANTKNISGCNILTSTQVDTNNLNCTGIDTDTITADGIYGGETLNIAFGLFDSSLNKNLNCDQNNIVSCNEFDCNLITATKGIVNELKAMIIYRDDTFLDSVLDFTTQDRIIVESGERITIQNNDALEFGHGVAGKNTISGVIRYQGFSSGLDIVGAGNVDGERLVTIFDKLSVAHVATTTLNTKVVNDTVTKGYFENTSSGGFEDFIVTAPAGYTIYSAQWYIDGVSAPTTYTYRDSHTTAGLTHTFAVGTYAIKCYYLSIEN